MAESTTALASPHLSDRIISPADIRRALRELETVDNQLYQAGLRHNNDRPIQLPAFSRLLEGLVDGSGLDMLRQDDRKRLLEYCHALIEQAPVLHVSFAAEPSAPFMSRLLSWLRTNIHPQVLVTVGLQPGIAAGCIVRTSMRQYDLSLLQAFERQRGLLAESLHDPASDQAATAGTVAASNTQEQSA